MEGIQLEFLMARCRGARSLPMLDSNTTVVGSLEEAIGGIAEQLRSAYITLGSGIMEVAVVGHGGRDSNRCLVVLEAALRRRACCCPMKSPNRSCASSMSFPGPSCTKRGPCESTSRDGCAPGLSKEFGGTRSTQSRAR